MSAPLRRTILLLIASAVGAEAAPAPPVEREARVLSDEAMVRFRRGEYAAAIDGFKAAHALVPEPRLLFNLGQAYRLSGDCPRAAESYHAFLATAGAAASLRGKVEALLSALPCASREDVAPATPPAVAPAQIAAPPPSPVPVPAPPIAQAIAPQSAPENGRQVARKSRPSPTLAVAGSVLLSFAIVAGGTAVGVAIRARGDGATVDALFQNGGAWDDGARAVELDGKRSATAATALFAIGGAAAIAGTVLVVIAARRRPAARAGMALLPSGAALQLACDF